MHIETPGSDDKYQFVKTVSGVTVAQITDVAYTIYAQTSPATAGISLEISCGGTTLRYLNFEPAYNGGAQTNTWTAYDDAAADGAQWWMSGGTDACGDVDGGPPSGDTLRSWADFQDLVGERPVARVGINAGTGPATDTYVTSFTFNGTMTDFEVTAPSPTESTPAETTSPSETATTSAPPSGTATTSAPPSAAATDEASPSATATDDNGSGSGSGSDGDDDSDGSGSGDDNGSGSGSGSGSGAEETPTAVPGGNGAPSDTNSAAWLLVVAALGSAGALAWYRLTSRHDQ